MKKAIAISIDVEKSLIENEIFEHFEGDSDRIRSTLQVLKEGTLKHMSFLKEYAKKV